MCVQNNIKKEKDTLGKRMNSKPNEIKNPVLRCGQKILKEVSNLKTILFSLYLLVQSEIHPAKTVEEYS